MNGCCENLVLLLLKSNAAYVSFNKAIEMVKERTDNKLILSLSNEIEAVRSKNDLHAVLNYKSNAFN